MTTPKDIKRMNADRNYLIEQQEKRLNDLREETAPRKRIRTYQLEPLEVMFRTTYANEPDREEIIRAFKDQALVQLENIIKDKVYFKQIVSSEEDNA